MSRKAKIGLGIGAIVLVFGAISVLGGAGRGNRPVEVRTQEVSRRDLVAAVTASGKIEAKSQVDVSSEVTARITRLTVKEGDMVQKGQLLVVLDEVQFKGAVDRAEASLASVLASEVQAVANRDQAKRAYDRQLELRRLSSAGVSEEVLEEAKRAYDVAVAISKSSEAQVQQARAGLRESQDNLARTKIMAPISGRVVRLALEEGEVAVPGTFSRETGLIMRIADLSIIQAKVKVDETDVVRLELNDSVSVTIDAFPDTTFIARVTRIGNSAATTSAAGQSTDRAVDFEVEITLSNPPKDVRPDLSMTARIITDVRKQALSIPIIALTARTDSALSTDAKPGTPLTTPSPTDSASNKKPKEREGVFVVNNGVAMFRPVKVGIAGDEYFEVVDGLKQAETVVSGSYQAIRDMRDSTKIKVTQGAGAEVKRP